MAYPCCQITLPSADMLQEQTLDEMHNEHAQGVLVTGVHSVVKEDQGAQLRDAVQVDHAQQGQRHWPHCGQRAPALAGDRSSSVHTLRLTCLWKGL